MEKMIATDCEGTQNGYRCWAAGEEGFQFAVSRVIKSAVREAVHEVIVEHRMLADEEIDALRAIVKREAREAERWEAIKRQTLGWGVIAIAGWLGTFALKAIEHWRNGQ
ncbi:MAG: hypothetical protein WAS33_02105 [Candidatus Promineifilaceae bacterium]